MNFYYEHLKDFLWIMPFNALAICGFYTACWYKQKDVDDHTPDEESKMVLWWFKFYTLKILGNYWSKPICTCPPCMSSIHSLWIWLFIPFSLQIIPLYIFYILCLCGLMKLISVKFEL